MAETQITNVNLAHGSYSVHPQALASVHWLNGVQNPVPSNANANAIPASLIKLPSLSSIASLEDHIQQIFNEFTTSDDVFSQDFQENLVIQLSSAIEREQAQKSFAVLNKFKSVHLLDSADDRVPPGPYFIQHSQIHQAWKLYPDTLEGFVITTIPEDALNPNKFMRLNALSEDGHFLQVAVPSRLYSTVSPEKPFAGKRMAIKDNFKLKGIKTTMMNRAYAELYPGEVETAKYIEDVIAKGAVIVGKTKMCSFASAEKPPDQWIDYLCPYNPRGDLYQCPAGSSTGSAVTLAGYEWLDFSLGTDTTGSIRAPAACAGLFSLRTSFGVGSVEGVVPTFYDFDVIGFFSRSLSDLHKVSLETLNIPNCTNYPKRIIYPLDFLPKQDKTQQAMIEEFVSVLEKFLGVKRVEINMAERWDKCPPAAANGKSLKEYLKNSAYWPMYYEVYHNFDKFRDDYRKEFGKEAYVSPFMQFRWNLGKTISKEQRDIGLKEMGVVREWFKENIMAYDDKTLSDAVMIMPNGQAGPRYRDTPAGPPTVAEAWTENYFSPVLGLPQLIIPIGQNSYESRVSGRLEHRPIVSSIIGAKGSDLMLINLANMALTASSWPTSVQTGRYMWKVGPNIRNTA
ncbi:hypothetical protein TWF694_004748 [Orbilia ellipsospora]|uniref:Amidase domain-containing protein n=1 Tax=Orbilia ellipsospora TaxID=2528407 RepID=A0AAV9WXB3_9PEZI